MEGFVNSAPPPRDYDDVYTVVLHEALVPEFKKWLASRGLQLGGPVRHTIHEGDLGDTTKFYVVGPTDESIRRSSDVRTVH